MASKSAILLISLCLFSVYCDRIIARQDSINKDLEITEAERKIDISTHLIKITSAITIENGGKTSTGYFLVPIDTALRNYLSYFGASVRIMSTVYSSYSFANCICMFH